MKFPKSSKTKNQISHTNYSPFSTMGFTIIEILVVFTLIAVLSGIGFAAFVNYSRSQQVNQAANDIKLLIGQARSNALSAVKTNTDDAGDSVDCGTDTEGNPIALEGYTITKIGQTSITLGQQCQGQNEIVIDTFDLPSNVTFTIASTCTTVFFNSLTSQASGSPIPCNLVVNGYGLTKTITIDAIGNVSIP